MSKKYVRNTAMLIGIVCATTGMESCKNDPRAGDSQKHHVNEPLFAKGDKVNSKNFTGTVWLNYLSETDSLHNVNIGVVTFAPGARTNWHLHKGGQILLITSGKGLYQEKGGTVKIINKGDIIKCPPGVAHWHGATHTDEMAHIAIGTNTNIGGAEWLRPVTDEEYEKVVSN